MLSLEERIQQFLASPAGQAKINKAMTTNKDFGTLNGKGGMQSVAKNYAERMKAILREEVRVSDLVSSTTGEYFLDHIDFKVYFQSGIGWVADVYFIEDAVTRESFGDTWAFVYLPYLINNRWSDSPVGKISGFDRHGHYTGASDKYMDGAFKGFIFRAVQRFYKEVDSNVKITIDDNYKE